MKSFRIITRTLKIVITMLCMCFRLFHFRHLNN